ncbi:MAG: MBOAT family protein [Ruminococcaceae bacterium]|jgi:D-alanyl-lipoteichoic acid acyltransferase DltB (MBOAT superfamily)|nr:MBOAT family protein [Oscillospiraceae bacterium]
MIFTSFAFLAFFAVTAALYFLLPARFRWMALLACSMYFYICAGFRYVFYLLFTAASIYLAGVLIARQTEKTDRWLKETKPDKDARKLAKQKTQRKNRAVLALCVCVNLGILAVIKYLNFGSNLLSVFLGKFGVALTPLHLSFALPLGISFYTFQSIGYLTDVYRGVCEAQRNPLKLLLFLSFFPCVLQGPINRYNDLAPRLYAGNSFSYDRMTRGAQRMLWGFFEKLVIADRLNTVVSAVFGNSADYNGAQLWIVVILYAFQIYADFQGYMDIACGAAEVLGIPIAENFDSPYLSSSVPEFWRRWHITLGSWFRDYVYYPIMRSGWFSSIRRRTKGRPTAKAADRLMTVFALFAVWGLTGLWHGAKTTYIAWGLYYGLLISLSTLLSPLFDRIVSKTGLDRDRPSYRLAQILKTFFTVCVGYVFFRADSLHHARDILTQMFTDAGASKLLTLDLTALGLSAKDWNVAFLGLAILIFVDICRSKKLVIRDHLRAQGLWLRWLIWLAGLFAVLIYGVYGPGYDAASFIYFGF